MATGRGGAYVSIGADASAVKPALDNVVRSIQDGSGQVSAAFQGWVGNSNAVATATEKLERALKSFRSEQKGQEKLAKFFSNELVELVPAAEGAKNAIKGLVGLGLEGLTGGLSFGLAFEAVKLLIGAIQGIEEPAKKAFENADKAVSKILDEWTKKVQSMERALAVLRGGEGAGIRFDLAASLKEVNKEIAEAQSKMGSAVLTGTMLELNRQLDALYAKRQAIIAQAAKTYATEKEVQRVKDEQAAAIKRQKDATEELTNALKQYWSEVKQGLQLSNMQKLLEPTSPYAKSGIKGPEGGTLMGAQVGLETPVINTGFFGEKQNAEAKKMKKSLDDSKKAMDELKMAGAAIGDVFSSVGDAIGGMAGKLMGTFGKLIQQAIQLAIALSATAGPWGWLNVAASAAAILATIMTVPEFRAEGGPVSAYRPYLVGERGPELIVPSQSGTVIPNEQLSGGVTVNFNGVVDADSYWRSNERHIIKTLRDASRAGRY